jgi:hypothetical protein
MRQTRAKPGSAHASHGARYAVFRNMIFRNSRLRDLMLPVPDRQEPLLGASIVSPAAGTAIVPH